MTLRIATFNVKDFFVPRSEAERSVAPQKFANLASNLRRANADVVALQEVGEPELLARFVDSLADLGYSATVVGPEDKRGIRCALVSRLPVLASHIHTREALPFPVFIEGDAEPFGARIPLRRGVVHVRVKCTDVAGGEVDVITAHLKSNRPAWMRSRDGRDLRTDTARGRGEAVVRSLVQRAAEALFVRGVVDDRLRSAPERAVCLLGDFNDHPDSLTLRILRGEGHAPPGAVLTQSDLLFACAERVPAENRYSCIHGDRKTLIDHVLVSKSLFSQLQTFEIYNEDLRYHGAYADAVVPTEDSDHALCVASFA